MSDEPPYELPLAVRPLTADDAMDIASWRYPGAWSVYDSDRAPRDDEGIRAVVDAAGRLVGFACLGVEARVPGLAEDPRMLDVGIGMRPELTGRGLGPVLGRTVVAYAREVAGGHRLRCVVQDWNERSLKVARASGFVDAGEHVVGSGPDAMRYVVLTQP